MKQLFGIREMSVHHGVDALTTVDLQLMAEPGYDAQHIYEFRDWDDLFPGNVIVQCAHCSQWAARRTACKHCGAPIS